MHQSKTIITALLALLVLLGGVYVWQKRQAEKVPPVPRENPAPDTPLTQQDLSTRYPQHIVPIAGTDEVWYQIPELGIQMRMNREFGEDLVYEYVPTDKQSMSSKDGLIHFFKLSLAANGNAALRGNLDNSIGTLSKSFGRPEDVTNDDRFQSLMDSPYGEDQIQRFSDFYLYFMRPQGVCVVGKSRPIEEQQKNLCYIFHTAEPI